MNHRSIAVIVAFLFLVGSALATKPPTSPNMSEDEQIIWNKEHAYWQYVEKNDLTSYANLWHENFLGWPSVSAAPVRKDHITDWITNQTSKGLTFKVGQIKPANLQVTGNVASCCYWVTLAWLDKKGKGPPSIIRITHTWLKTGDEWQIISGMSMPEPKPAAK